MANQRVIGVDFGTSTSVIRVKNYDEHGTPLGERLGAKDVVFHTGQTMVPTLVQYLSDKTFYGYDALVPKRKAILYQNFKVDLEARNIEQQAAARQLTKEFFQYLANTYREQSDNGYFGDTSDEERTIVSYPVKWSEATRAFMLRTAREAGFRNVEGMDEAQAAIQAILTQSFDLLTQKGYLKAGVPVYILLGDMGAGTTDFVLCRYTPGKIFRNEILCTWPKGDDIFFGGREADELLQSHIRQFLPDDFADSILQKCGLETFKKWKETVVSPALARNETVTEFGRLDEILDLLGIEIADYSLDRKTLETEGQSCLNKFPQLVNGCLAAAGVRGEDVDLMILTGGHSQWYFVKEMLIGRLHGVEKIHLPKIQADSNRLVKIARPQETVSLGTVYTPLFPTVSISMEPTPTPETGPGPGSKPENSTSGTKRMQMLHQLAGEGQVQAQYNLAVCYATGDGVPQDYKRAVQWYQKAAGQGHMNAQYNLALCYASGNGIQQDYKQAAFLYYRAAEQGQVAAQYNLGVCYERGLGVSKDDRQAVCWYQKAAEQDHLQAQYNLGVCYANGIGVPRNHKQAIQWFQKAAERGHVNAQYNLGVCYANGDGVPQDYEKAVAWYQKAAEQGHIQAQYNLGICYERGLGVQQNHQEAAKWYPIQWFLKNAEQGQASAQYNLGICYASGRGVPRNYEEAVQWFRKAAEQGHVQAQYNLGVCYTNGNGVSRNYAQALQWYQQAAKQGHVGAKKAIQQLSAILRRGKNP